MPADRAGLNALHRTISRLSARQRARYVPRIRRDNVLIPAQAAHRNEMMSPAVTE
jgi:hypothetical protein